MSQSMVSALQHSNLQLRGTARQVVRKTGHKSNPIFEILNFPVVFFFGYLCRRDFASDQCFGIFFFYIPLSMPFLT